MLERGSRASASVTESFFLFSFRHQAIRERRGEIFKIWNLYCTNIILSMHIMAVWQGAAVVITQHCVTVNHVMLVLGDPTTSYLYYEDTNHLT